jgi:Flp pilus assembly protein TadG
MAQRFREILRRPIDRLRAMARDERGNIALITAFMAVPLVVGGGMMIDYDRVSRVRTRLQASLDAGALASAATGALDANLAKTVFTNNFAATDATVTALSFGTDAGGDIVGTATASVPTTFTGVVGIQTLQTTVTSTAVPLPKRITSATFKSVSAQGAFSKDVFLFTRDAAGKILTNTTVLLYRYSTANGGTKTYTPSVGVTKTISVGAYETYGVGLVIYQDLTYTGKLTNAVTKYSDAADASTWIHKSGTCDAPNGVQYNIEDGGDSNFLDFVYTMTCVVGTSSSDKVRLSQ